jgi:hypothetical protein
MLEVKALITAFRYQHIREILSAGQIPKESCGQLRNRWTLPTGVEGSGWGAAGPEFGPAPLRIAS